MKDFRFYLEFPDKATKKKSGRGNVGHAGNVVAVMPDTLRQRMDGKMDAVGAVFFHPNSQCASTSAAREYLWERCKRIPESTWKVLVCGRPLLRR